MYQALLGTQGQSRAGLLGLAAGLGAGLCVLALVALLVRSTSVRLPLRAFFKVRGAVLFALAVVFAGNAVFELQQSGLLKTTALAGPAPLRWLGQGIPIAGPLSQSPDPLGPGALASRRGARPGPAAHRPAGRG